MLHSNPVTPVTLRGTVCQDQRGSALVAVIGLMAVAAIVTVTVSTLSVGALRFTNSTRTGVQAQTAAQSGIDVAAASLAGSTCQPNFSHNTEPKYSVDVYFTRSTTGSTLWSGCPNAFDADTVQIVSKGTGVGSSLPTAKVEAIYAYLPVPPTPWASGAAIYAYSQTDPTITNLTITQASTARPVVQYRTGDVTCLAGTIINGDVILGQGSLSSTSECTINGDLWASGTVDLKKGKIAGNVYAAGIAGNSITTDKDTNVQGSLYAAGPVSVGYKVGGNVVSGPTLGVSTFASTASVGGSVVTAGTVSRAAGALIAGTVTQNKPGIVTPIVPPVPGWVDYPYTAGDWTTAAGIPFGVTTVVNCGQLSAVLATAQASLTPTIVDTRICGTNTDLKNIDLTLKSDMVIVANGFNLQQNNIQSSDTSEKRLWVIIPDRGVANNKVPDCPSGGSATVSTQVVIGPHVGAMIYSPCDVTNKADSWRGQMYASSVKNSAPFTLSYLPIGIPTVNLSTGESAPIVVPGSGKLGSRISSRDRSVP